jgi:hypothetical protein
MWHTSKLGVIGRHISGARVDSATLFRFLDSTRLRPFSTLALWLSIPLIGVVAYLPAIDNDFISDDFALLLFVEDLEQHPWAIWDSVSEFFRLVSYVYFWVTFKLFGLRPEPYYLASIALHTAASLLVFALVRAVTGRPLPAWVAAIFFVAYARHEEAVMWISANNETILTLNCLVFLLVWELHLSGKRPRLSYFAGLVAFVVALFSKETSVVLVPLAMFRTRIRWRNVQILQSRRFTVVITEKASKSLSASYRSRWVPEHLVWCDDPIAEPLMIAFKVVMCAEMLN